MTWQKPSKRNVSEMWTYYARKGNKLLCSNEACGFVKTHKTLEIDINY